MLAARLILINQSLDLHRTTSCAGSANADFPPTRPGNLIPIKRRASAAAHAAPVNRV
jgi:hypothetical protein